MIRPRAWGRWPAVLLLLWRSEGNDRGQARAETSVEQTVTHGVPTLLVEKEAEHSAAFLRPSTRHLLPRETSFESREFISSNSPLSMVGCWSQKSGCS